MIESDVTQSNTLPMNPIALIEAKAAARSAVLGARATDSVVAGAKSPAKRAWKFDRAPNRPVARAGYGHARCKPGEA